MSRARVAEAFAEQYRAPSERAIEMARLYAEEGLTQDQIAERYKITRQRVSQLLAPFGFTAHYGLRNRRERQAQLRAAYEEIVAGRSTLSEQAEHLGYANGESLRAMLMELGLHFPRTPAVHGSRGRYARGCRCDECRAGNRERVRKLRQRGSAPTHGTVSGYSNYGCRCDECRAAWRVKTREVRIARRRKKEVVTE